MDVGHFVEIFFDGLKNILLLYFKTFTLSSFFIINAVVNEIIQNKKRPPCARGPNFGKEEQKGGASAPSQSVCFYIGRLT